MKKKLFFPCTILRPFLVATPLVLVMAAAIRLNDAVDTLVKLYPLIIACGAGIIFTFIYFFRGITVSKDEVRYIGVFSSRDSAVINEGKTLILTLKAKNKVAIDLYGNNGVNAELDWLRGEAVRDKVASADAEAFSFIAGGDPDGFAAFVRKTGATICGHVPIELALRAFPEGASIVRQKYATSSDGDGDYSRFVCYVAATGCVKWPGEGRAVLSADDRAYLLRLARAAMEHAVRSGNSPLVRHSLGEGGFPVPHSPPKTTLSKMGAFVTLNDKATGALRGCIGEILPMRPLVDAVAARAVDSALHDPRFMPVTERELANLRVEVSALTPPKPVGSWRDIVLGRDGMTLEKGGAFAVFLPQVAPEQGWDLPTTLSYLSRKAGLSADAWREGATFETFQAEVFHE